jgi:hemerythrin
MPLLQWNPSISVLNAEMDSEHKKLVDILNMLYDAMKGGRGKEVLERVFSELIDYTKFHFSDEEKLMEKCSFPGLREHASQHRDLEGQVMDLYNRFKSGQAFISLDVMDFLKEWLTTHIQQSDKKYGEYLNGKGIF